MDREEFLKLLKECIEDGSISFDIVIDDYMCKCKYEDNCGCKAFLIIKINGVAIEECKNYP